MTQIYHFPPLFSCQQSQRIYYRISNRDARSFRQNDPRRRISSDEIVKSADGIMLIDVANTQGRNVSLRDPGSTQICSGDAFHRGLRTGSILGVSPMIDLPEVQWPLFIFHHSVSSRCGLIRKNHHRKKSIFLY